jgi:hypothetical protein
MPRLKIIVKLRRPHFLQALKGSVMHTMRPFH